MARSLIAARQPITKRPPPPGNLAPLTNNEHAVGFHELSPPAGSRVHAGGATGKERLEVGVQVAPRQHGAPSGGASAPLKACMPATHGRAARTRARARARDLHGGQQRQALTTCGRALGFVPVSSASCT